MFRFSLVSVGGDPLGPIELGRPDWPAGSLIYGSGEATLHVVDVTPSDDPEGFTILVVEAGP